MPITASSALIPAVLKLSVKFIIETNVESFFITKPEFCNPINAINKPIPTETAFLSDSGMESNIASRTLVSERAIKISPSIKTASRATCHGYPYPITTV